MKLSTSLSGIYSAGSRSSGRNGTHVWVKRGGMGPFSKTENNLQNGGHAGTGSGLGSHRESGPASCTPSTSLPAERSRSMQQRWRTSTHPSEAVPAFTIGNAASTAAVIASRVLIVRRGTGRGGYLCSISADGRFTKCRPRSSDPPRANGHSCCPLISQ